MDYTFIKNNLFIENILKNHNYKEENDRLGDLCRLIMFGEQRYFYSDNEGVKLMNYDQYVAYLLIQKLITVKEIQTVCKLLENCKKFFEDMGYGVISKEENNPYINYGFSKEKFKNYVYNNSSKEDIKKYTIDNLIPPIPSSFLKLDSLSDHSSLPVITSEQQKTIPIYSIASPIPIIEKVTSNPISIFSLMPQIDLERKFNTLKGINVYKATHEDLEDFVNLRKELQIRKELEKELEQYKKHQATSFTIQSKQFPERSEQIRSDLEKELEMYKQNQATSLKVQLFQKKIVETEVVEKKEQSSPVRTGTIEEESKGIRVSSSEEKIEQSSSKLEQKKEQASPVTAGTIEEESKGIRVSSEEKKEQSSSKLEQKKEQAFSFTTGTIEEESKGIRVSSSQEKIQEDNVPIEEKKIVSDQKIEIDEMKQENIMVNILEIVKYILYMNELTTEITITNLTVVQLSKDFLQEISTIDLSILNMFRNVDKMIKLGFLKRTDEILEIFISSIFDFITQLNINSMLMLTSRNKNLSPGPVSLDSASSDSTSSGHVSREMKEQFVDPIFQKNIENFLMNDEYKDLKISTFVEEWNIPNCGKLNDNLNLRRFPELLLAVAANIDPLFTNKTNKYGFYVTPEEVPFMIHWAFTRIERYELPKLIGDITLLEAIKFFSDDTKITEFFSDVRDKINETYPNLIVGIRDPKTLIKIFEDISSKDKDFKMFLFIKVRDYTSGTWLGLSTDFVSLQKIINEYKRDQDKIVITKAMLE